MIALSPRLLRRALLVALLAIGVSVVWTYRRGRPEPTVAAPDPSATPGVPRTTKLVYTSSKGESGEPRIVVNAESQVGKEEEELRLSGVNASFAYVQQGQPAKGFIASDECIYTPSLSKAVFLGHVKLTTADGFELRTESLVYRGDKQVAHSEHPVEFRRKDVSGRSKGLRYDAAAGTVEFPAEVVVRVEDAPKPPGEIQAGQAVLMEAEKTLHFGGGVTVVQGADRLTADRFEADFDDNRVIYRARAIENVVLDSTGGSLLGTTAQPQARGPRHLTARRLDLWLRPDHSISEALAGPEAELTLMPGPHEAAERRRVSAKFLKFSFDEQEHLTALTGEKEASLFVEPLREAKTGGKTSTAKTSAAKPSTPPRSVSSDSFGARLDPKTGEVQTVDFKKDVAFAQGAQHGTAQEASYDGPSGMLYLTQQPVLIDEEQGSELHANAIDVTTRTGDLAARGEIRHVIRGRAGSLLGGGDQPVQITSGTFVYVAEDHTARYRVSALLRSGKDEVRAPELRLRDKDGRRRLEALGGVVSLLHPRPVEGGETKDSPATSSPFDGRSRDMTYDESAREIVYKGDAVLRQAEMVTKSPEATLRLDADGRSIESMQAGEPIEVQQGTRKATARRGVYTLADKKMVLTGDRVVLTDPEREVHGRSVVFHVGDDRVQVDGQGLSRTQSILRSRPEPAKR